MYVISALEQETVSGFMNKGEGIGVMVTVSRISDSQRLPVKRLLGSLMVVLIIPCTTPRFHLTCILLVSRSPVSIVPLVTVQL